MSALIDNEMRFEEQVPRKKRKDKANALGKAEDEDIVRHELMLNWVVASHNHARLEKRIDNQGAGDFSKSDGPKNHQIKRVELSNGIRPFLFGPRGKANVRVLNAKGKKGHEENDGGGILVNAILGLADNG